MDVNVIEFAGGARFDDGAGGDNEVQRTMLEIVNQLDGFDARGNVKVLMATNRPDTLDPALLRPGRMDRRVEFGVPDLEGRTEILKIHSGNMNCAPDIRFELLARLCPNCTGADLRSVCTEAGMYAIRARRKQISEKDMLDAINKVIKGYAKFSATPKVFIFYLQRVPFFNLFDTRICRSTWSTIDRSTCSIVCGAKCCGILIISADVSKFPAFMTFIAVHCTFRPSCDFV